MISLNKKIEEKIKIIIYFLLIISSFNIILTFYQKSIIGDIGYLGDSEIFLCALNKYFSDINPYGRLDCFGSTNMHYHYTPLSLILLLPLNSFDIDFYRILWIFIEIFSILIIFYYSKKIFSLNINSFILFLLILFSFGGAGWSGFLSGNISVILSALILFGIYQLSKNNKFIFSICIIIATLFKPFLLIFFLIGFKLYKLEFIKYFFNSIFFLICIHLFYFSLNKELYFNYFEIISFTQTKDFYINLGNGIGLIGLINGFLYNYGINNLDIILLNFAKSFWLISVFIFSLIFITLKNKNLDKKTKISYSIILCSLLNPYLMNYDLFLCVPSILFIFQNNFILYNKRNNKIFYFCILIYLITIHDKFACLFLLSVIIFLFFIKNISNLKTKKI